MTEYRMRRLSNGLPSAMRRAMLREHESVTVNKASAVGKTTVSTFPFTPQAPSALNMQYASNCYKADEHNLVEATMSVVKEIFGEINATKKSA